MPIGIIIDASCVLLGGLLGVVLSRYISENLKQVLPVTFGLSSAALSITLITGVQSLMIVTLSLIVGTAIGELLCLDRRIRNGVAAIKERLLHEQTAVPEETMSVILTLIVLFCFSPTGILGSMIEGFSGAYDVFLTKAVLDFFTAAIFATTVGIFVPMIAVPQFAIFFVLFLLAKTIMPYINDTMIANFRACGGVINLAVALNLLKIKQLKPLNMLPALLFVLLLSAILV